MERKQKTDRELEWRIKSRLLVSERGGWGEMICCRRKEKGFVEKTKMKDDPFFSFFDQTSFKKKEKSFQTDPELFIYVSNFKTSLEITVFTH